MAEDRQEQRRSMKGYGQEEGRNRAGFGQEQGRNKAGLGQEYNQSRSRLRAGQVQGRSQLEALQFLRLPFNGACPYRAGRWPGLYSLSSSNQLCRFPGNLQAVYK